MIYLGFQCVLTFKISNQRKLKVRIASLQFCWTPKHVRERIGQCLFFTSIFRWNKRKKALTLCKRKTKLERKRWVFKMLPKCGHGPIFSGWLKATSYKRWMICRISDRNMQRLFHSAWMRRETGAKASGQNRNDESTRLNSDWVTDTAYICNHTIM